MIQRIVLFLFSLVLFVRCEGESEKCPFADCVAPFEQEEAFEVVTLDLENFPKQTNSILHTADLLLRMNADVVALQGISNEGALKQLVSLMNGWEFVISPEAEEGCALAFLFKISEVELIKDEVKSLSVHLSPSIAPEPLQIKVLHRPSGIETYLINVYRSEEPEEDEFSMEVSNQLKRKLDIDYAKDYVVVLGQLGASVEGRCQEETLFASFKNDSVNYRIVGRPIVSDENIICSYTPGLDQMNSYLISNEWFNAFEGVITVCADGCYDDYAKVISHHRPVVLLFHP